MQGGSHKQHNATQRYQCARHHTASNHLIRHFIVRKNAFVVAERMEDALRARLRQWWHGKWAINAVIAEVGCSTNLSGFSCRLKRSMQHLSSRLVPQSFSKGTRLQGCIQLHLSRAVFSLN